VDQAVVAHVQADGPVAARALVQDVVVRLGPVAIEEWRARPVLLDLEVPSRPRGPVADHVALVVHEVGAVGPHLLHGLAGDVHGPEVAAEGRPVSRHDHRIILLGSSGQSSARELLRGADD
jgi:hypothetical protein